SSSRCGRSDAWVCSRSQGQPFGARSRSAIRVTVASEARSANGSSGGSTRKRAPPSSRSASPSVLSRSRSPSRSATGWSAGYRERRRLQSGTASSAIATGRIVANVCRSSALAGTTSTPEGQRSKSDSSARRGSEGGEAPFNGLLELETGDEAEDVVRLLLLVQPVLVRVVLDLR